MSVRTLERLLLAVAVVVTLAVALAVVEVATARPDAACNARCVERVKAHHRAEVRRRHRARWRSVASPYWGIFTAIARCESGLNWGAYSRARDSHGNPLFYGGLQFTLRSWAGVGGHGNPVTASELEQRYRAVLLMRAQGYGAWPVCRRSAGV